MKRYQVHVEIPSSQTTWDCFVAYESQRCQKALRKAADLRQTATSAVMVFDTKERTYTYNGVIWIRMSAFLEMQRTAKGAYRRLEG